MRFLAVLGAGLIVTTHTANVGHAAVANRESGIRLAWCNRMTWGLSPSSPKNCTTTHDARLSQPSKTVDNMLPPKAAAQVAAMRLSREPMSALVVAEEAQNRAANALTGGDQKKSAQQAYQQSMNALANEAATRSLLRDLYSSDQLREQMTWFWFNHFNVQAQKRDIRAMVGDYEDQAIRPRALGKFRDLLEATLRHPAMLRYLDNDQNTGGHINENYAREIMELHSMGVGSGYSQTDVQELARILTGVGVDLKPDAPKLKSAWQPLLVRAGLFEFNPARHDFGDKQFLGQTIKGAGFS